MTSSSLDWALVGGTGFVGSSLSRTIPFAASFNSVTIDSIAGRAFETVVCAGAPAVKWAANKDPIGDLENLKRLMSALKKVQTRHLVLISTIDVYTRPDGVDESDVPSEHPEAYGRNRRALEVFVESEFERSTIIRLPGLFGEGLKKNIIFDLIHNNQVEKINPASRFQWYPLERFHLDLHAIIKSGLPLVNIAPEPVGTLEILTALFPDVSVGPAAHPAASYDMHTRYAGVLGGFGRYHLSASAVLASLGAFVANETA